LSIPALQSPAETIQKKDTLLTKAHILDEIRRTAKENGGVPFGHRRFFSETGIRYHDWFGKHWARWGDAVREAGFAANKIRTTESYTEETLIEKYIALIRELGRIPARGDIDLKSRSDPSFPSERTLRRLTSKTRTIAKVRDYCATHTGFEDVAELCMGVIPAEKTPAHKNTELDSDGFVYLIKSGRRYKIGKTKSIGRREYELAIQLPEKPRTIHVIRTDDPDGIEIYWHRRFAAKRKNPSEFFDLDSADVQAFKRRKFM
jgi:hypothetical protein